MITLNYIYGPNNKALKNDHTNIKHKAQKHDHTKLSMDIKNKALKNTILICLHGYQE
jgi:hypothetical protein